MTTTPNDPTPKAPTPEQTAATPETPDLGDGPSSHETAPDEPVEDVRDSGDGPSSHETAGDDPAGLTTNRRDDAPTRREETPTGDAPA